MNRKKLTYNIGAAGMLALCVFSGIFAASAADSAGGGKTDAAITVTSSSFHANQSIPAPFGCEGGDSSPALQWSGVPSGAKSLALICEDPDAPSGTWSHWILWNLPATTTELAAKQSTAETLSNGAKQGTNDFKRIGYSGPCPPPGKAHRYIFTIYALDATLSLKAGATRQQLLRAMEGHILAQGRIMGTYQRKE